MSARIPLRLFGGGWVGVATTDADGTLISQQRYLPFGQVRGDIQSPYLSPTDFGYTGQRDLAEMGLMDYRARMYDAVLGRFIQPDTMVTSYGNPQSLNRFTYVGNNPILLSDPTGHKEACGIMGEECGDGGGSSGGGDGGNGGGDDEGGTPPPTPTPTPTSTPPPLPTCSWSQPCGPAPTPTYSGPSVVAPTPTPYSGPIITSPPPSFSLPYPSISFPNQVDKLDAVIDGAALGLDFVTIGAVLTGHLEVAAASEILGDVVGSVGVIKAGVDAYNSYKTSGLPDLSGLAKSEFGWALTKAVRRGYGVVPVAGTVANAVNFVNDLHPTITIKWTHK